MKVLVTGGTGFIGRSLVARLNSEGFKVVLLCRDVGKAKEMFDFSVEVYKWENITEPPPEEAFIDVEAVINLMGESISKRWSGSQKEKIYNSRVKATKMLMSRVHGSIRVVVSNSAIGFYPVNVDRVLTEQDMHGSGFLSKVCVEWEAASFKNGGDHRVVIPRLGIVLGQGGGILGKILPIFKLGLGGVLGKGQQIMSWIHMDDLVEFYINSITKSSYKGVYNLVSPMPVSNLNFTRGLAETINRSAIFGVPKALIKMGVGEMSTLLLDGQIVSSRKLELEGFLFKYRDINSALRDICKTELDL